MKHRSETEVLEDRKLWEPLRARDAIANARRLPGT